MAHRGQWSEHEARSVIIAWRKSGESIERFAKARGLVPQRIRWWRSKLEGKVASAEAPLALLPVRIKMPRVPTKPVTADERLAKASR